MSKKYIPFHDEAPKLAREGEELTARAFMKAEVFEKATCSMATMLGALQEMMKTGKRFRMELIYDPESLNVNYCFFAAKEGASSDMNQESATD